MSKVVREKHLNIIELLLQATEVTAHLIEGKKLQDCLILLADCQESAVALGGHIEKLYGINTKTVAILEQYCECLYQMSVALDDGIQIDAAYEALQQVTKQIEEVYIEEFPDRKEVVFLPYKAAMWDSLESVWKAADEDPDCDAYVIPIPYFDRISDGGFGELHYEGDLYPKYVPITDYKEFDFEEHRPDMIYIHNPYDEYNLVTSVHPRFYARELKKYTEELVYIPYFVLREIEPEDQVSVNKMKHFITTQGVIYADKVIVQSEKMKQIYVNEYLKFAKENGLLGKHVDRDYQEQRILGNGSPKFDKIVKMKKEDFDIPKEWLSVIEKADGSWKKIIFYNTSIGGMLNYREDYIKKIQDVIDVFFEKRDKVVLLWRPHPLLEDTLKSMRPDLLQKYKILVENYKKQQWGIYDDTPDMYMGIVLSDAYYGDGSSVQHVFEKTKKPILLQNPSVLYSEER